jgi:type IV secretory pathway VirB10-like protein
MASMDKDLSPITERVLKFSVDRSGADGLRYEDYMEGLSTVLTGITISQLSIALHQLESKGYLHPDPHGTPNRKIRVTALGRQALEGKKGGPAAPGAPQQAPTQVQVVTTTVVSSPQVPAPLPESQPQPPTPPEVKIAPPSPPAPEPVRAQEDNSAASDQTGGDVRRRLRAVIERESSVEVAEDKVRRKETDLLNEEERLAALEKSIETRRRALEEQEKQVTAAEDALHEHLTTLKGHLASMNSVSEGVHKLHEKVSNSRAQRRQKNQ